MSDDKRYSAPFPAGSSLQEYFATLPKNLQEQFMQSGAQVRTEQELQQCVEQLRGRIDK